MPTTAASKTVWFRLLPVLCLLAAGAAGCNSENVAEGTAAVVGKAVETGKGVAKGISDGIEKGRKSSESVDGAALVSNITELEAGGSVSLGKVAAGEAPQGAAAQTEVELIFENTREQPMRVAGLKVLCLDAEGFAKQPSGVRSELTVPARSKQKLSLTVDLKPESLATVRVWDKELAAP